MFTCTLCQGKGLLENKTPFGVSATCYRCDGSGKLLIQQLQHGDHCLHPYRSLKEQIDIIVLFLSEGLKQRDRCVCLVDRSKIKAVKEAFELNQMNLDNESLTLIPSDEFYLSDGKFVPEKIFSAWIQSLDQIRQTPFQGLRAIGELPPSILQPAASSEIIFYEALVHDHLSKTDSAFLAICQYDALLFSHHLIRLVSSCHNTLVAN